MKKRNIFWGVVFLVIAACILITELGYFPGINIFKLVLAAALIALLIQSHGRYSGSRFLAASVFPFCSRKSTGKTNMHFPDLIIMKALHTHSQPANRKMAVMSRRK